MAEHSPVDVSSEPPEAPEEGSLDQILSDEIGRGLEELERSTGGLFLSGLSAGMDVGFSVLLMGTAVTLFSGTLSEPVIAALVSNLYAVGFIFVVLGRSELFTEHTALATFPVLNGRASLWALSRLWAVVYASNLVGAAIFAGIAALIGPKLTIIEPRSFFIIADFVVGYQWWAVFVSAILAGWLMGLLSWLVSATNDTISKMACVWLVATSIGFAKLHHSIVGSVEVLAAIFAGQQVTFGQYGHFLVWATLGNIVGGVFFVAVVKYGHSIRVGSSD